MSAVDDAWVVESQPVQPVQPGKPVTGEGGGGSGWTILDEVRAWFDRFICTLEEADLDLLALWAVHTHVCVETYTTPRLQLDSPVPGSGKTTVLEHLERVCMHPVQMASLASPALLTRMLDSGMRTILIDEADRTLSPDKEGVGELIAVLNSGYKRGGTRPVLVPTKESGWITKEMPTFAPVAFAGNDPKIPDDTKSRTLRVLLMPDTHGEAEDSDWETYDDAARDLGRRVALWAEGVKDEIRTNRPVLPEGIRGRNRERWAPLKRVAVAAGGRWPMVVDELALREAREIAAEHEDGIVQQRPSVAVLRHIHEVWPDGETFLPTEDLVERLRWHNPEAWGADSSKGKPLTAQALGRMLSRNYKITSCRPVQPGPRGYSRSSLEPAFHRFGLDPSKKPADPVEPAEPAEGPSSLNDFFAAKEATA
ncbi:DUF3631 domain-containing protein [Mumia flava]|uniref:DUF3631 domain-containing protein n=1 Tax=Mumia flava TaxID=1348852 RepID=UPI001FE7369E|nr:DUF3631 domain-containing protein [Mumia flava]